MRKQYDVKQIDQLIDLCKSLDSVCAFNCTEKDCSACNIILIQQLVRQLEAK